MTLTTTNLGHRAARGAFVTLAGQGLKILVQMASVVILARLLTPHAYGLVAMVTAIVGVAGIFRDFGLSSAAIQAESLSKGQRNNLFWINTSIGFVLTIIIAACSPLIAFMYHDHDLIYVTLALSVTFLINGAAAQYRADLSRALNFRMLAVADVISSAAALVIAAGMALAGFSYWSIVVQQLAQAVIMTLILGWAAGWLPKRWAHGEPVAEFIRFGWHYVGSQLMNYAANNVDTVIIGIRLGASPAGLYNRGFQLLMRPLTQLRAPSTTVALPTLAALQHDMQRFGEFVVRGQRALGYPLVLAMGLVVGAADPMTRLLLGSQWMSVVPILQFLAIAGAFQTLSFVGLWVYLSMGITAELRRYTVISASIRVACVAAGSMFGVVGVAAGYALGPAIAWPLAMWWLNRKVDIPTRELMLGGLRIVVVGIGAGVAAGTVCYFISSMAALPQLIAATLACALMTALMCLLSRVVRRDIQELLMIGRRALARVPARS